MWWPAFVGCEDSPAWTLVAEDPPGAPLAGLPDDLVDRFDQGDAAFEALVRETQGLGPVYIRAACGGCHADDARGPGFPRKMAVRDGDGWSADPTLLPWGSTERPYVAGGATTPILPPTDVDGLVLSVRSPPGVFGRGYLEAIDESEILAVEQAQADAGVVSGRVNRVCWAFDAPSPDAFAIAEPGDCGLVGRFGAKARIPSLVGFTADAFQGDMAVTSPLRSTELPNPDGLTDDALPGLDLDAETVELVAEYVRLLRIPTRPAEDPVGAALFTEIGCAECHVPALRTRADHPIAALRDLDAPVFTDLLVHDLGPDHADGLTEGVAGPSEWRTAPLIGMRFLRTYLHDGRATTVDEAIVGHGGPGSEAEPSVASFEALSDAERDAVTAYVESL
ncbi:MAG: di-heme oxidoredictase family protein [Myxococcota bacterium]